MWGKENQLPMVSMNAIKGRASLRHVVLGRYWLCGVEVGGFLIIQAMRAIPKGTFKWHSVGPASQGPTYKSGIYTSYLEPCAHQETSGIWTLWTVGLFGASDPSHQRALWPFRQGRYLQPQGPMQAPVRPWDTCPRGPAGC